jgi:hypothetical protein
MWGSPISGGLLRALNPASGLRDFHPYELNSSGLKEGPAPSPLMVPCFRRTSRTYKLLQIFVFEKDNLLHKHQLILENVHYYDFLKSIIMEIHILHELLA